MMGKLAGFEILLDNPNGVYYAGSFVEGTVSIDLSSPIKMRGLHIKLKGKSHVQFQQRGEENTTHDFTNKEKYFEKDVLLFGNAPSEHYSAVELDIGHHDYPFRIQLPHGLPSSFDAPEGSITYKATAKIVRLDKENHEAVQTFTVCSVLDLNMKPEYRSPLSGSNQKHLCCCCCKSGPISAQFYIERQGWVPGEAIRLYADIKNGASRTIDKSYVSLIMNTEFIAKERSYEKSQTVARVHRPSIIGHGEDSWRGELLYIPSLPPTNLGGSKIIKVEYVLKLNVDPSGPSLDLEIPLSIVIGTVPLNVVDQPLPYGSYPPEFSVGGPTAPPVDTMPPPSYVESMGAYGGVPSATDERTHLNDNRSFTPSYTFYNNWGEPVPQPEPEPERDTKKQLIDL